MNETLGFASFLNHADGVTLGVLVCLLLGSIVSWYLIATKALALLRQGRQSQAFLQAFWSAPSGEPLRTPSQAAPAQDPFAHVLHHGQAALAHWKAHSQATDQVPTAWPAAADEMLVRALRRAIEDSKLRLEHGQTYLATVASSAPFVGLLGTVWGIYHALMVIGQSGQSSLDKVAGPVGEALIMTGIGLAVAIPAAVAYNLFTRSARNTLVRLNAFAHDVHRFLAIGVKAAPLDAGSRT